MKKKWMAIRHDPDDAPKGQINDSSADRVQEPAIGVLCFHRSSDIAIYTIKQIEKKEYPDPDGRGFL